MIQPFGTILCCIIPSLLGIKIPFVLFWFSEQSVDMVADGGAPPRGSAAAAASMRRRRAAGGGAAAAGGGASTMLQFYTDDATGAKMSPNTVLFMSIGFIAVVALLHVVGKLYFVRR